MKSPRTSQAAPRTSIACAACRRRKTRCDGQWPACGYCSARSLSCGYDAPPPAAALALSSSAVAAETAKASLVEALRATLPPKDVQLSALRCFFELYVDNGLATFIHRSVVVEQLLKDELHIKLTLAILSLTARVCPAVKAAVLQEGRYEGSEAAQVDAAAAVYAQRALDIVRRDPDAASLARLQCLLILVLFDIGEGREARAWMLLTMAIRLVMILRLAKSEALDDGISGPSPLPGAPQTAIESEARRRTFWSTFLIARLLCDGHQRPAMMHFAYTCTIRMPRPDVAYEYGRWAHAARFEDSVPTWASPVASRASSPEPQPDLFGQLLRIAAIYSKVQTYIGEGGHSALDRRAPWSEQSTFAQLNAMVDRWQTNLPAQYHLTEPNRAAHAESGKSKIFVVLHATYYAAILCLYRDYIPFLPVGGIFESEHLHTSSADFIAETPAPDQFWPQNIERAYSAAETITSLISDANEGPIGGRVLSHPFTGMALLAAATVQVHRYWFSSRLEDVNLALAVKTAQALEQYRTIWPVANRWCRSLNALFDTYGQHREAVSLPTAPVVPGITAPPWTLAQEEQNARATSIVQRVDELPQTLREASVLPSRRRHDLFAFARGSALTPQSMPAINADCEISEDRPQSLAALLDMPELSFDDIALNSFTDWNLNGLGGDPSSSWWLA